MNPLLSWIKLGLLLLFIILTNHEIIARIETIGINFGLFVFICIWAICLMVILLVAFSQKLLVRLFWGLIISFSAFSGDLFYQVTGNHMSIFDIEILWQARNNTDQALSFYWSIFMSSLTTALLGLLAIVLPPPQKHALVSKPFSVAFSFSPLLPLLIISAIIYIRGGEGTNGLPNQASPISMAAFIGIYNTAFAQNVEREEISITYQKQHEKLKHIVLILDESIRADFLDINSDYGLLTNLIGRDNVANFGFAASASNCSDSTNVILRVGGTKETIPAAIATNPTLWSYAKQAGYKTVHIDAQISNGKLHNFMTETERDEIDHFIQADETVEMHQRDFVAAKIIKQYLQKETPHFIYFVKNGAHWPYEGKYPRERSPYKPYMEPNETPGENLEHMVNSYKNTILWTVGEFFNEFLSDINLDEILILYTSDHAQNLNHKRQGGFMSHCSSYNEHPTEGLVPLLTITNIPEFQHRFKQAAQTNFDKATHYNLFSTLLFLFGYQEQEVVTRYGHTLLQPINEAQEYLVVPLFVRFGRPLRWQPIPQRDSINAVDQDILPFR